MAASKPVAEALSTHTVHGCSLKHFVFVSITSKHKDTLASQKAKEKQ